MLYKYCAECRKLKEVSNFSSHKGSKDGYITRCKECECKRLKMFYQRKLKKVS